MTKERFRHVRVTTTANQVYTFYGLDKFDSRMLFVIQKEKDGMFKTYGFPLCNIQMFEAFEDKE